MISQSELKSRLSYSHESGQFTWIVAPSNFMRPGDKAGFENPQNHYVSIKIGKKMARAHKLAWLYHYGEMPDRQIDHINGIRSDNRIANLRLATPSENAQNKRKCGTRNSTGYLGATFHKQSGKFQAQIKYDGKARHLGLYKTAEEASAVYLKTKREHHPFCTI